MFEQAAEVAFLQEQTAGGTITNTLRIWKDYQADFLKAYLLPIIPFQFLCTLAIISDIKPAGMPPGSKSFLSEVFGEEIILLFLVVGRLGWMIASVICAAAVTMMTVDICRGHRTSVFDVLRRFTIRLILKALGTYLLFWLLGVFLLYALLYALGVFVSVAGDSLWLLAPLVVAIPFWLVLAMFAPITVVLEDRWGFSAFWRAISLCKGCHIGNLAAGVMMYGVITVLAFTFPSMVTYTLQDDPQSIFFILLVTHLVTDLITPLAIVYVVLVYYDLRIRKENYDIGALAEDLN